MHDFLFRPNPRIFVPGLVLSALLVAGRASAAFETGGATAPAQFPQPPGWPAIDRAYAAQEPVGPGVNYTHWKLSTAAGPLTLSITTVDLRNPFVSLAVAAHHDVVIGEGERLSSMADRSGAQAGINADYFDINNTGSPLNVLVMNGRIEHQPNGKAVLAIGADKRVSLGPLRWSGELVTRAGYALTIAAVNDLASGTSVSLITRRVGALDAADLTEVVLAPGEAPATYRVLRVGTKLAALFDLHEGELAIAARADTATQLADNVAVGDTVQLITQWQTLDTAGAADIALAVGGGPLLLRNGEPVDDPDPPAPQETNERYPVTGVGISQDRSTLWLVVVDGRYPRRSIGLTRPMLGALLKTLGAVDGMAFDSGGSSEMVVRHLGDARASVANMPSDGRERPIADGLFVVNAAQVGPAAQLIVRAPATALLVGSRMQLSVAAVDTNLQPVALSSSPHSLSVQPPELAEIDGNGRVLAKRAGEATISVFDRGLRAQLRIQIVPAVQRLSIVGDQPSVAAFGNEQLRLQAEGPNGTPIAIDEESVRWSVAGSGGWVDRHGRFFAGSNAARVVVLARVRGSTARLEVPVGEHAVAVALNPQVWRYAGLPSDLPGEVDGAPSPDGFPALRLAYDVSARTGFRAAYADGALDLPGEPTSVSVDVYGDGRGAWLRGAYRDADGVTNTVTLARHVDWIGWKRIRVPVSAESRWPLRWTRLYIIEASSAAREEGVLWFKDFAVNLPGP